MQHHVLDRSNGQRGVTVEPYRPVTYEASAVAVVAREMLLGGWFPQPKSKVSGRARAGDPGVVADRGLEFGAAPRNDKDSASGLAD